MDFRRALLQGRAERSGDALEILDRNGGAAGQVRAGEENPRPGGAGQRRTLARAPECRPTPLNAAGLPQCFGGNKLFLHVQSQLRVMALPPAPLIYGPPALGATENEKRCFSPFFRYNQMCCALKGRL